MKILQDCEFKDCEKCGSVNVEHDLAPDSIYSILQSFRYFKLFQPCSTSCLPLHSFGGWTPCHTSLLDQPLVFYRRKFRSQTSNNMDRWKSRGGKSMFSLCSGWQCYVIALFSGWKCYVIALFSGWKFCVIA